MQTVATMLRVALTFDTSSLDHLDVLETGEDIAADTEADLDAVLDTFLDSERVLLELCQLLLWLLQIDRDTAPGCRWRYQRESV